MFITKFICAGDTPTPSSFFSEGGRELESNNGNGNGEN